MKRKTYFSITLISLLFCSIYFYATLSSIKNEADERLRIIVNLDTAIVSGSTLITNTSNIQYENIRKLFIRFNVKELQAVYRNRYNEKGNLKPCTNTDSTGIWQQIIMNDYSRAPEFINLLKKEKGVLNAHIERPLPFKPCVAPNDAEYQSQWHLNSIGNPMADIRAQQAWDINKGRSDVIIAVCDGGVDYTHPDLDPGDRSRVIDGYDSGNDDNDPMDDLPTDAKLSFGGHGTHVAGIIGAITNNGSLNNGKNVAGVMWNCKIMPVKMVGDGSLTITYPFGSTNWDFSTTAFPSDVADAIDYAVNNGAHVINLSYGINSMGGLANDVFLRVPLLYQAILNAYNHNVVVVAAMGNEYNEGNPIEFPAFFRIVIAVGATTNSNPPSRWSNSNSGSHICVSAPGDNIISTLRGGSTGNKSGTSMAAPVVSGIAGLIISQGLDRNFNLTNDDVRHILERTADDITSTGIGFDNETGYGKVNAYRALSLLNTPNVLYHGVSIGGTSVKLSTISQWIYYGPQWGLASGIYYDVDQYQITKHITFDVPFCSIPQVWMRDRETTSLGFGNPNDGYPYAIITNITTTGFDIKYATYYVRYNSLGQAFNRWLPVEPASTKFAYTAVGSPNLAATTGPISGPSIICSSNATFTVNNIPDGCTISWNHSSNLTYISGQNTNSYTVAANGTGTGTVEAIIVATNCDSIVFSLYNVWVGGPLIPVISSSSPFNWSSDYGYPIAKEFTIVPGQDIDLYDESIIYGGLIENFQWTWNSDNVGNLYDMGAAHTMFLMDYPGSARIRVKVSNSCDETDWSLPVFVQATEDFVLSPNPASDNITITMNDKESVAPIITSDGANKSITQNASASVLTDYTIRIFNQLGTMKYNTTKSGKSFIISVNNLQNGNYFINISDGKNSNSRQFIIKH